jgi:hypothetical protein
MLASHIKPHEKVLHAREQEHRGTSYSHVVNDYKSNNLNMGNSKN